MNAYQERYNRYVRMVEHGLEEYLPNTQIVQAKLLDAMMYSVFAPAKRLRPVMTLAFCEALGGSAAAALPFACAIEMIHTYSLIHDDLPCMDNDDLRRGRPTNHKVFGEASALLAGDALLTAAFETILDADYVKDTPLPRVLSAAHRIAWASGLYGMAGGQMLDLEPASLPQEIDTAAQVCLLKTAALIEASAMVGCELADATKEQLNGASSFARCVGLAFQMKDDLLNIEGDPLLLGKSVGTDESLNKLTFVSLLGSDECRRLVGALTDCAVVYLDPLPERDFLTWLAQMLVGREH